MEDASSINVKLRETPNSNESTGMPDSSSSIKEQENQLLQAAVDGQLKTVQEILECKQPAVDINCTDTLGRTPLILAAEKGQDNEKIVRMLVENGADTTRALLHAVTQGNTETLQMLLSYYSSERKKPSTENEHSKLTSSVLPLMLACKLGNYEMVKLLISYGEQVTEHDNNCSCDTCVTAESNMYRAAIRLESYKALSSPLYISAQYLVNPETVKDPIDKAFELSEKLKILAGVEYEFKDEYLKLSEGLDTFVVDLLDECLGLEEAQMVMKTEDPLAIRQHVSEEARNLYILDVAVKNKNEEFIAHPYSQLLLNNEVFRKYPKFRHVGWKIKYFLSPVAVVLLPVFLLCYMFLPNSRVTNFLRTPLVKYITFMCSYLVFLLLLIYSAFQPIGDFMQGSIVGYLVCAYNIGYFLDTANEIYHNGFKRYFSNWYNYVLVAMITSWAMYYTTWATGRAILISKYRGFEAARQNIAEVSELISFKVVLYSFGFNNMGVLLAFLYLLSIVHLHPTLGPLLMALKRMLQDVANFFIFFFIFFVAFVVCLKKLYLQYDQSYTKFFLGAVNDTTWQPHKMASIDGSIAVAFWALFGLIELDEFDTEEHYSIMSSIAKIFFALFNVVAVLVTLNMLIAILNESFIQQAASPDVKWKYSRTKMLLTMMHRSSVLPPPFSVIPTPRAAIQFFQCIKRACCGRDKCCDAVNCRTGTQRQQKTDDDKNKRQEVIKQLVLRYLCTADNRKDSATSTVEKLDRARRDLARLLMPSAREFRKQPEVEEQVQNTNL